jgi:hypothetical protein
VDTTGNVWFKLIYRPRSETWKTGCRCHVPAYESSGQVPAMVMAMAMAMAMAIDDGKSCDPEIAPSFDGGLGPRLQWKASLPRFSRPRTLTRWPASYSRHVYALHRSTGLLILSNFDDLCEVFIDILAISWAAERQMLGELTKIDGESGIIRIICIQRRTTNADMLSVCYRKSRPSIIIVTNRLGDNGCRF